MTHHPMLKGVTLVITDDWSVLRGSIPAGPPGCPAVSLVTTPIPPPPPPCSKTVPPPCEASTPSWYGEQQQQAMIAATTTIADDDNEVCSSNSTNPSDSISLAISAAASTADAAAAAGDDADGRGKSRDGTVQFALAYAGVGGVVPKGATTEQFACTKAAAALSAKEPVASVATRRLKVYGTVAPAAASTPAAQRYDRIRKKALEVLRKNTLSPEGILKQRYAVPDVTHHREMPIWDTSFTALGMLAYDPHVAWELMQSLIGNQVTSGANAGWMPLSTYPDGKYRSFGKPATQYPMLSYTVWRIYNVTKNKTALEWAFPRLEGYLGWDERVRDRDGNFLLQWDFPCWDNNQRFDPARTAGRKQDSVDFSAVAAQDMFHLSMIAAELGNASRARYWKSFGDNTTAAINTLLWDETAQFYFERFDNGTFNPTFTPAGLMPLLLDIPQERVSALVAKLINTSIFNVSAGLPTTSVSDPQYSNNMWRGGMWLPINYLIIQGLVAKGMPDLARALAVKTVDPVGRWYEALGSIFEFYDAKDVTAPSKTNRKYCTGCGSTSEYSWSAAAAYGLIAQFNLVEAD